jgi:hypothetical protein
MSLLRIQKLPVGVDQPDFPEATGGTMMAKDPYCEVYKVVFARAESHARKILHRRPLGEFPIETKKLTPKRCPPRSTVLRC